MPNFSITISNPIRCFGPAPTDMWGVAPLNTFTWGVSKWGEGDVSMTIVHTLNQLISNILTITDSRSRIAEYFRTKTNLYPCDSELTSEGLSIGAYSYVYVSDTSELEDRSIATYTSGVAASQTYTSGVAAGTSWS